MDADASVHANDEKWNEKRLEMGLKHDDTMDGSGIVTEEDICCFFDVIW